MEDYCERNGRKRGDGAKLVGALSTQKLLQYDPLLRWYVEHGAVVKAVHRIRRINYQARTIFTWFVEQVTEARCTRDVDKSNALPVKVFKTAGKQWLRATHEELER